MAEDAIIFNGTAIELKDGDLAVYLKNIEAYGYPTVASHSPDKS